MRVLESGGTVEQHKAAIAAMKFEHQAAACSANGCDGGVGGASGHHVNGSTFVPVQHHHQRTLNGGVGGGTQAAALACGVGKKGAATKFDEMSSIGYPKAYGGELYMFFCIFIL